MKIRKGFVTNSSSSSFILAKKREFTEKEKQIILDFMTEKLLGVPELTSESTEEQRQDSFRMNSVYDEEVMDAINQALADGKTVYVSPEDNFNTFDLGELWEKLLNSGSNNFEFLYGEC